MQLHEVSMKHSTKCENADPKSICRCKCGGKYHGISHKTGTSWIRTINSNIGGSAGKLIQSLQGKKFQCSCGHTINLNHFLAYDHDGGYKDKHSNKWWIFIECPNCKYQWSIDKILTRMPTLKEWL